MMIKHWTSLSPQGPGSPALYRPGENILIEKYNSEQTFDMVYMKYICIDSQKMFRPKIFF